MHNGNPLYIYKYKILGGAKGQFPPHPLISPSIVHKVCLPTKNPFI